MKEARCSGPRCNAKIIWAVTDNGSKIPLTPLRTLYYVHVENLDEVQAKKIDRQGGSQVYVSHFETCPDANKF